MSSAQADFLVIMAGLLQDYRRAIPRGRDFGGSRPLRWRVHRDCNEALVKKSFPGMDAIGGGSSAGWTART